MTNQYPYPAEDVKKNCLSHIKRTNHQLELYNMFLEDAIAQIDSELCEKKWERLKKKGHPANFS
jgi:hypothetical protein